MAEDVEVPRGAEHVGELGVEEHVERVEGGEADAALQLDRDVLRLAHLEHLVDGAALARVVVEVAAEFPRELKVAAALA